VVKLVYTPALGAGTARCGGSSPLLGTESFGNAEVVTNNNFWVYTPCLGEVPQGVEVQVLSSAQSKAMGRERANCFARVRGLEDAEYVVTSPTTGGGSET
jgi:hypothetical protein